jgi:UDPglucose 6-dehydrogenase
MGPGGAVKITVLGLWHLGCVTAACTASEFDAVGLDFDADVVAQLNAGRAPLFEPGLDDLIAKGLESGRLSFSTDPAKACEGTDILWLTYDTPVDDDDQADVDSVIQQLDRCLACVSPGTLVLISSQLPVGTCRMLEARFPQYRFACSPENLRLGKAIDAFTKADRAIVGVRDEASKKILEELFRPFAREILFMRTESAEMVKHALNSFLALSITFINEVGRLCDVTGADASEVTAGLKSDIRIGPRAYLGAGGPFAGGTLARDVVALTKIAAREKQEIDVIPAIKRSNDRHRRWALDTLARELGGLRGHRIAIVGLTYTAHTSTLRRSAAVELCRDLVNEGATITAYDPAAVELPQSLAAVTRCDSLSDALQGVDAAVICTAWPEFREQNWAAHVAAMQRLLIVDADRFLDRAVANIPGLQYLSVGRSS